MVVKMTHVKIVFASCAFVVTDAHEAVLVLERDRTNYYEVQFMLIVL